MKKVLFFAIAVLSFSALSAQFHFGPQIGYTASKLTTNTDEIKSDFKNNFLFGAFVRIGEKIYVQPEVNWLTQGGIWKDEEVDEEIEMNYKTVQIPVSVGWRMIDLKLVNIRIFGGLAANIATNKEMTVIDCSEGAELKKAKDEHEEGHESHSGLDPHIWMSPLNAQVMVRNICDGLVEVDSGNRNYYEQNRDAYLQQLADIDSKLREGLAEVENRRFMVYHPAFGYFASEYDLEMITIEEGGKEPTAADLVHLIEQAKAHDIRVIFAEPQFNPKSAEVIAEAIGGRVVLIDPLARDYIGNLRIILNEMLPIME